MTRQVVRMSGSEQVCAVCGDTPFADYHVDDLAPLLFRLCSDCRMIQESMRGGERFVPVT